MKNKFIIAAAVLFSATLITSCSIEKRHYMSGYHVQWNKAANKNTTAAVEQKSTQTLTDNQTAPVVVEQNSVVSAPAAPAENTVQNAVAPAIAQENTGKTINSVSVKSNGTALPQEVAKQDVTTKQEVRAAVKKTEKAGGDVPKGLLIVLCFLMPWLAVGLATDWDVKTIVINLLWSLTCIGAIIHAIIVVNRETK